MVATGTKALAAAVVEAPRTECALNIWLSIPAFCMMDLNQRPSVVEVTGLCGRMKEINR